MSQARLKLSWAKLLLLVSVTATLYFVTARLGLTLALPPEKKATAVWLPSGIALAAILIGSYRVWPGIWLGAFLANIWDSFGPTTPFTLGVHIGVSSAIAVGSTLQALLGAALLHRWIGPEGILNGARSAFKFVCVALLVCTVASTIGVASLMVAGFTQWPKFAFAWWTWWVGDTIGIIIITPLILTWSKLPGFARDPRHLAEAAFLLALLLGVSLFIFAGLSPWGVITGTLAYLTIPLLVWATFRFGHHGATASLLVVSKIAVWGTALGFGPYVQGTLNESLLLLQTYMGVLGVTTLALAGVLAERRRAEQARLTAYQQLERAHHEIKTLRGLIPICAWCKKIRNDGGAWEQLEAYLRGHTEAEFSHSICPECVEKRHSLMS